MDTIHLWVFVVILLTPKLEFAAMEVKGWDEDQYTCEKKRQAFESKPNWLIGEEHYFIRGISLCRPVDTSMLPRCE